MNKTTNRQNADVKRIYTLFSQYISAYSQEFTRLRRCEEIYCGGHWQDSFSDDPKEPRPVTPVLQSTIESLRAELLDKLPEAIIVADDPAHTDIAKIVNEVIRENHTVNGYHEEYRKLTQDLLVGGYMVQEIGYDPGINKVGGAFIRYVDNQSVMFDPCVRDIQDSRMIFKFTPHTREWYRLNHKKSEPLMKSDAFGYSISGEGIQTGQSETILLIECWEKEQDPYTGGQCVHMCKVAGGVLLEDSREIKPDGYFSHGKYPFIVTPLFQRKGTPLGYGFVDMFFNQQMFSDKLDQIVLKNALMASKNKLLITGASGFDADDMRDWSKEVHEGDSLSGVTWFPTPPLPSYVINYINSIREGIKEESGVTDVSRGGTNGVTAASAIIALQEASSKRSRMISRMLHSAFCEAVKQEIEVEREFSLFSRQILVGGEKKEFSSHMLYLHSRLNNELPLELKVSVKVQQENRFSMIAHNELIFKLVELNMIPTKAGLELLHFDGKEQALAVAKQFEQESGQTETL